MIHKSLGFCNKLIEFTGERNKLILVSAPKTMGYETQSENRWRFDGKLKILSTKNNAKDKFWILWGAKESDESKLGTACLSYDNGRAWPQAKAIKEFMKIAETVDTLTMSKLY